MRATVALMEEAFVVSHPFIIEFKDKSEGAEGGEGEHTHMHGHEQEQGHTQAEGGDRGGDSGAANSAGLRGSYAPAAAPQYKLPPKIRAVLEALDDLGAGGDVI